MSMRISLVDVEIGMPNLLTLQMSRVHVTNLATFSRSPRVPAPLSLISPWKMRDISSPLLKD